MAKIHTPIPSLKLNDGTSLPMLAWGAGTAWYKKNAGSIDQAMVDAIKIAINMGYYHLDGAEVYNTERELGLAMKESEVDREELYVVTKVNQNVHHIEAALQASLEKLQVDYVDLYLIHAPWFAHQGRTISGTLDEEALQKAWSTMEKIKSSGKARSIGVSNFMPEHLTAILKSAKVPPAINQVEFHPYLQQTELVASEFFFLQARFALGYDNVQQHPISANVSQYIATSAYGPLTAATKAKPGPIDDLLAALAKKYGVSEAEVSLRWCIDQDVVAITTSSKEQRLSDYLRCTKFKLTPAELKQLNELGETKHYRGFWSKEFDA